MQIGEQEGGRECAGGHGPAVQPGVPKASRSWTASKWAVAGNLRMILDGQSSGSA